MKVWLRAIMVATQRCGQVGGFEPAQASQGTGQEKVPCPSEHGSIGNKVAGQ